MTVNTLKDALSSLLGLPRGAVVEEQGAQVHLTNMAFNELCTLVNLPAGYQLTSRVGKPDRGDYFLDVESLVEHERVVIYRATGNVKAVNIILRHNTKSKSCDKPNSREFDFLVCMLQGGQAQYKGQTVLVTAPVVDSSKRVAVLNDGQFKLVAVSELRNIVPELPANNVWTSFSDLTDIPFLSFEDPNPNTHHNRLNLEFDDEGYDPFFGLN